MPGKPSWINLSSQQQDELEQFLRPPSWRLLPGRELPSVFPDTLRAKIDSALLIAAPTSTGGVYLAFSANRIDFKDRAIDIEPFGVIVPLYRLWPFGGLHPSRPLGGWDAGHADRFLGGGFANSQYFLTNPPEHRCAGPLTQLPRGHGRAFDAVVREIRAREDGTKV